MHIRPPLGSVTLTLTIIGMLSAGLLSASPVMALSGQSWENPIVIQPSVKQFVDYHTLRGTGGVVYYRVTIAQPVTVTLQVRTSVSVASRFIPRVAVFAPFEDTIGPILPIVQPPLTMTHLYPGSLASPSFNVFTQTRSSIRLALTPTLAVPGTYYIAVYNAGAADGGIRFVWQNDTSTASSPALWQLPASWWRDQMFAGFSWLTLIFPMLLAVGLWIVWRRLDHHRLLVHKKYPARLPPTKTIPPTQPVKATGRRSAAIPVAAKPAPLAKRIVRSTPKNKRKV